MEELPEGTEASINPNAYRIRPRGQDIPATPSRDTSRDQEQAAPSSPGGWPGGCALAEDACRWC